MPVLQLIQFRNPKVMQVCSFDFFYYFNKFIIWLIWTEKYLCYREKLADGKKPINWHILHCSKFADGKDANTQNI